MADIENIPNSSDQKSNSEDGWGLKLVREGIDLAQQGIEKGVNFFSGSRLDPDSYVNDNRGDNLLQNAYDFSSRVFPSDLGMDYYGHYMVININVPTKGFSFTGSVGPAAGEYTDRFTVIGGTDGANLSTVDKLRFGLSDSAAGTSRPFFSVPRQTRRIAESIALYMPAGLNFNTFNEYKDLALAEMGMAAAGAIGSGLVQGAANLSALGKNPINPGIEVIFVTTNLREFNFQFLFAPRNETESRNLDDIIRTLRFHAAPEINADTTGLGIGITWIPPAEFDFMFFNKGVENRKIPRINTCVMTGMQIDYHPQSGSYSTFSNGYPVTVQLIMSFKELEPLHKQRVLQGFY